MYETLPCVRVGVFAGRVATGAGAAPPDLERLRAQLAAHDEDQGAVMNFDDFLRASEAPLPPLQPPTDDSTSAPPPFIPPPVSFIPPPNAFAGIPGYSTYFQSLYCIRII